MKTVTALLLAEDPVPETTTVESSPDLLSQYRTKTKATIVVDPLTTSLVKSSFKSIGATPGGENAFAQSFYAILFAARPEIRQYFPAAMDLQRDRLMRAVGYVVERLDSPETVLPLLAQLGRDHRKYDITDDDYAAVGEALVTALAGLAGPELWTDETAHAWHSAVALIVTTMTEAARGEPGPPTWVGTVRDHRRVLDDLAIVRLQLDQPMPYAPGQYVSVQIHSRPPARRPGVGLDPRGTRVRTQHLAPASARRHGDPRLHRPGEVTPVRAPASREVDARTLRCGRALRWRPRWPPGRSRPTSGR